MKKQEVIKNNAGGITKKKHTGRGIKKQEGI
jgi:hypothetical protein